MKIIDIINISKNFNINKSIRRIFFINKDESKDGFHANILYGSGTGILLHFNNSYFLLTAKHVIGNLTNFSFSNESPFWIGLHSTSFIDNEFEILYPGKIWFIGELIQDNDSIVNINDQVLIELFPPILPPDNFIDLSRNSDLYLNEKEINELHEIYRKENMHGLLIGYGYPFDLNSFDWENNLKEGATHSTNIIRKIISLSLIKHDDEFHTEILEKDLSYEDLTGMSGGLISNSVTNEADQKIIGMIVSGGNHIIRFIPFFKIIENIKNYRSARSQLVDPNFEINPITLDPKKMEALFLKKMDYLHSKFDFGRINSQETLDK